jgi:hypothetical protein
MIWLAPSFVDVKVSLSVPEIEAVRLTPAADKAWLRSSSDLNRRRLGGGIVGDSRRTDRDRGGGTSRVREGEHATGESAPGSGSKHLPWLFGRSQRR